jgi:hypothetical protein
MLEQLWQTVTGLSLHIADVSGETKGDEARQACQQEACSSRGHEQHTLNNHCIHEAKH